MQPLFRSKRWRSAAVLLLLAVYAAQVLHAIGGQSLTWDEDDHIFAGYQIWHTHDYGLNPEHPPLVKMLGTLPLLGLPLHVPALQGRFFKTEAYLDGRELLFRNGPANGGHYTAQTLVLRARLAAGILGLATALLVFAAATEMFSPAAGLFALLLFCFEPNLLAHSAYVTTDMAASGTLFATIYALWRWVQRPTPLRLLVVGLAGGLALAAKHSTVLLLPMVVLLLAVVAMEAWRRTPATAAKATLRLAGALAVIVLVAVTVLWAFYGFRYAARPAGLSLAPTLTGYVLPLAPHEARGILLAARLHLLPESYLYGLADVRSMANGMPSYFFGKVYEHGLWYYFPILFTIKTTLAMLALLLLTAFTAARGWLSHRRHALLFLTLPPTLYLIVAMSSHLNIGARHILPLWVFTCVLCGAGAAALLQRGRAWATVIVLLLAAHIATTVHAAPNYISYANEAWGGPTQTYRYLTDSNTDWGQQLIATSAYLNQRHIQNCWIAYFVTPFVLPQDYGIPCRLLPTPDTLYNDLRLPVPPVIDGPVLISAGDLNWFEAGSDTLNPYAALHYQRPTAFIQNGIFVFDGRFHFPLASALIYVQQSQAALKANDAPTALAAAQTAEHLAPGALQTELALGDALALTGDKPAAREAFARAAAAIATMEPQAQIVWTNTLATSQAKAQ